MKNANKLSYLIVSAGGLLASISAFGGDPTQRALSPLELYNRCRAHLTQSPIPLAAPPNPSSLSQAVGLCMQLLTTVTKSQDPTTGAVKNPSTDTLAVLRTMDEFHRTNFFPEDSLATSANMGTRKMKDETEPALFYDLALFFDPVFSDILTTPYNGIEALRGTNLTPATVTPNYYTTQMSLLPNPFSLSSGGGVEVGDLLGVRLINSNNPKYSLSASAATSTTSSQTFYLHQFPSANFPSAGGGIIGNLTYLELTLGRAFGEKMDGGILQPRRWSKAVFKDILCRDLPTMRVGDPASLNLVEPNPGPLTPPFRKEASCMQCHGAMDPMASTVRTYSYHDMLYKSSTGNGDYGVYLLSAPVTKAAETGIYTDANGFPYVDQDSYFYQRPANGRLRYRSYDGTFINTAVVGAAGLGSAIANATNSSGINDFYVCAASRYFRYFTGINANLADVADPANTVSLSKAEQYYRNMVVNLGALLQKADADFKNSAINCTTSPPTNSSSFSCANGNTALQQLIYAIISNPLYQKKSMRDVGVP